VQTNHPFVMTMMMSATMLAEARSARAADSDTSSSSEGAAGRPLAAPSTPGAAAPPTAGDPSSPLPRAKPADANDAEDVTARAPARSPGDRGVGATASKFDVTRDQLGASLAVVGAAVMRERGLFDVNSALQLVPGVTPVFEYGGFQFMTIRGFEEYTVLDDFRRDDRNTFVTSAPLSGLWDVDRIEVLRGPAAATYGYSSIGGVINIVRKRPTAGESSTMFAQFGSPEQQRLHLGLNRTFLEDSVRARVDAGTEYRIDARGATARRTGGSVSLALFPGARHSVGVRLAASRDHYNTDAGLPTVNGAVPEGVTLDRRFNTPQDGMTYTRASVDVDYIGRLAEGLELIDRMRYAHDDYRYFSTEVLSVASDNANVNREYFFLDRRWRPLFNQLELSSKHTFSSDVANHALVGYELSLMSSTHPRSRVWAIPVQPVPLRGGNRADPQPAVDFARDAEDDMSQVSNALYAQDRLTLPWGFAVDLSGRFDAWERTRRRDKWDPATQQLIERGQPSVFETKALTGRAALVFKPNEVSSTYVSAANAFRPNDVITADNRRFDPQRGVQFEIGQSLTLGRQAALHASAYLIRKTNVVVPLGQDLFNQAAGIASRGGDVQLDLNFARWLVGTVAYAYTDATFTNYRTESGADLSGNRPRVVANHSGSFWLTTSPLTELKVSLGARGQGDAFADNANTVKMPAFVTFDAASSWRVGDVSIGATVRNLTDRRRYFTSTINGTQLTPGPGRELLVNLQLDL
jgi:iron complex outermembrane receptor protein